MDTNLKTKCLLCGCTAELLEEKYPGYQESDTFKIYYCPHCSTSFSLPRVETEEIYEHIYQNADKLPGYNRYWKYKEATKNNVNPLKYLAENEEMYWAVKSVVTGIIKHKEELRILEVGCGLGYLTYALIKEGYNVKGLDISHNAIREAVENYGNHFICADVLEYANQNKKLYDIIILTEVIEHVEEPILLLKSLINLLTEKGKIILTTPNKTIFSTNIIWNTELPPVHLWWFSEDSMRYIANKIQTRIQFIDFSDYYKKKQGYCNVKKQRNVQEISSFLSSDGKVVASVINKMKPKNNLRSIIANISIVKRIYNANISIVKRIYSKLNHNQYTYGKRGTILGVVFTVDIPLN